MAKAANGFYLLQPGFSLSGHSGSRWAALQTAVSCDGQHARHGQSCSRQHQCRLQAPFDQATTWLMWRQGKRGANLQAWIDLQQSETIDRPSEAAVCA
jgi:hypothetical protein